MTDLSLDRPTDALPLTHQSRPTKTIYNRDSYLLGRPSFYNKSATLSIAAAAGEEKALSESFSHSGWSTYQALENDGVEVGLQVYDEVGRPPKTEPADSPSPSPEGAQRDRLLAILNALPLVAERKARRLAIVTRAFLLIPQFAQAIAHGWSDQELYGLARHAPEPRLAEQGLVSGLALSSLNSPKLVEIHADAAVIRVGGSGAHLTYRRFSGNTDCAVPWWEIPAFCDPLPPTAE